MLRRAILGFMRLGMAVTAAAVLSLCSPESGRASASEPSRNSGADVK